MIAGLGVDIVAVERVARVLGRRPGFAARVLGPEEMRQFAARRHSARHLARRFAAKEAIAKALGTGIGRGLGFHQIHISNDRCGAPKVRLRGHALRLLQRMGGRQIHLSIADEARYATATAIAQ